MEKLRAHRFGQPRPWPMLAAVVTLSLVLAGCGGTTAPTAAPVVATSMPPTDLPTVAAPPTDVPTVAAPPTETPLPPTDTATPMPPTDTPTVAPTNTPTEVPPTDTPTPTNTAKPKPTATKPKPTATKPKPTAKPAPTSPPATQGCLLIQNFIGAELTITFTAKDRPWNGSVKVESMGTTIYCLDPGRYSFTVDAPPPWSSMNGDFEINAGDMLLFPIRGG